MPGIPLAILSRGMSLGHASSRFFLILLTSFVSVGRLHAHTVAGPGAVTQEINRCLMIVRIAATRRADSPQKPVARPAPAKGKRFDDYQVPAGTPLVVRLRTSLDSASGQVDDSVRATLLSALKTAPMAKTNSTPGAGSSTVAFDRNDSKKMPG